LLFRYIAVVTSATSSSDSLSQSPNPLSAASTYHHSASWKVEYPANHCLRRNTRKISTANKKADFSVYYLLMKNPILPLLIILLTSGCKHKPLIAYNKALWKIPGEYEFDYMRLKASPREVRESQHQEGGNPGDNFGKGPGDYVIYTFDQGGDLIGTNKYFNNQLALISKLAFNPTGYTDRTWPVGNTDPQNVSILTCIFLSDSSFKSWYNHVDLVRVMYASFSADGNKCVRTAFDDTSAAAKPLERAVDYYDGQRLLKTEIWDSAYGNSELQWYYSNGNSPDSVLYVAGGQIKHKEVYVNNTWGDPQSYVKVVGMDTVEQATILYAYDSKGNWIKSMETRFGRQAMPGASSLKDTKIVTIKERQIKY
jgi:hypothetical protein